MQPVMADIPPAEGLIAGEPQIRLGPLPCADVITLQKELRWQLEVNFSMLVVQQ